MADFDDIDALLSGSLKSAAEPANSAGVADLIRSRVAAGDAGTTVAGSTAPGWGGSSLGPVLGSIGLIVVAGVVGGVLGVSGVFGATQPPLPDGTIPSYVVTSDAAPAYTCPDGANIDNIPAGTRVFAVARNDDTSWLGVRDPDDVERTLWVETSVVVLDPGMDTAALPTDGCPEATVTEIEPEPTEEPTTEPTKPPTNNPQTPTDTTPPVVKPGNFNPAGVHGTGAAPYCNEYSDIVVTMADNVGIASVSASQSHPGSSITQIAQNGQNYTFRFVAGVYSYPSPDLNVTVTFTAKDAAGNTASNTKSITIYNTCLI